MIVRVEPASPQGAGATAAAGSGEDGAAGDDEVADQKLLPAFESTSVPAPDLVNCPVPFSAPFAVSVAPVGT